MGVNIIRKDSVKERKKTVAELQAELEATRHKLDAAIQSNAMLEDCLVEMAEAVYG